MIEKLEELEKEKADLKAQLDRANASLEDWKQRAGRMALKAKPFLTRATEPQADGPETSNLLDDMSTIDRFVICRAPAYIEAKDRVVAHISATKPRVDGECNSCGEDIGCECSARVRLGPCWACEKHECADPCMDQADPRVDDPFGDPLADAMDRIKELLSMFKCESCYDKGWVVGIEVADPGGGDPGSEFQVGCPDCSSVEPTEPRPMSEAPRDGEFWNQAMLKLIDCPFCGAPDEGGVRVASEDSGELHVAYCPKCEAQGPHTKGSAEDAVRAWNSATTKPRDMSDAPRVWVGGAGSRMHAGLVEWLGFGCGWVRTSGGLPIEAGTIFVPAGHPIPEGEPLNVTPCYVVDWLPASGGEES